MCLIRARLGTNNLVFDIFFSFEFDFQSQVEGLNVGPLKMAAMNGLTLSRSVVLSLMNDESRAPTDDRVSCEVNAMCFLFLEINGTFL